MGINNKKKIDLAKQAINKLLCGKMINTGEMLHILSVFETRKISDYPVDKGGIEESYGFPKFKLRKSICSNITDNYTELFSKDQGFRIYGKFWTNKSLRYFEKGEFWRESSSITFRMYKDDIEEILRGHAGRNRYALISDEHGCLRLEPEWKEKITWDYNTGDIKTYDRYNNWNELRKHGNFTRFSYELVKGGYYYHYYDYDA